MKETERAAAIQVRVSEEEKLRLNRIARRYGMATSSYLRRVGLGGDLPTIPPERLRALYRQVHDIISQISTQPTEATYAQLEDLAGQILAAYTGIPSDGDHENMAH